MIGYGILSARRGLKNYASKTTSIIVGEKLYCKDNTSQK
jgi:hypothetical protein